MDHGAANELRGFEREIRSFIERQVSAGDFMRVYFDAFKNTKRMWGPEIHGLLEDMFFALEYFDEDPGLRDPGDLDEPALRREATRVVDELHSILERHGAHEQR